MVIVNSDTYVEILGTHGIQMMQWSKPNELYSNPLESQSLKTYGNYANKKLSSKWNPNDNIFPQGQ